MKASVHWLRELSGCDLDAAAIAETLTAAGLEVEGMTSLGAGLAGVIAAEVRAQRPHPQADKLTLVDVFDGEAVTQVVCGAPNVPAAGGRVAWARPGARLPSGLTLTAKEVRGVLSPGMLCAPDELGLSDEHAGILILDAGTPPGTDVAELLQLPDTILEVNVTPNRPDCLGHLGLARELAALVPGAKLRSLEVDLTRWESEREIRGLAEVILEDPTGCLRYTARVIEGVTVRPSPLPMQVRLARLGIRAINNIVDATNLGLLETGHPLHAFDLDRLTRQTVVVRRARAGEKIVTLDGQERSLTPQDLAICDPEWPVAIAGVMGGRDSEVGPETTRILLESAHFAPTAIRRTAQRFALHSEASLRFERGTDPNQGVALSSQRCAVRIAKWAGGQLARGLIDRYPAPVVPHRTTLRSERTERVLGVALSPAEQVQILTSLGIDIVASDGTIQCAVPTFRPDLTREIDLIEEVARVRGYQKIPATLPPSAVAAERTAAPGDLVRDALAALGLSEVITLAFISPHQLARTQIGDAVVRLANPLREEQSVMRPSLLPGLLSALALNQRQHRGDVALFEVGATFHPVEGAAPREVLRAGLVLSGRRTGWLKGGEPIDFYDLKGIVDALLTKLRITEIAFAASSDSPWLHPGLAASVSVDGRTIGRFGELHPAIRSTWDLESGVFLLEIEVAPLASAALPRFKEAPRFPGITRDLSFFVAAGIPAAEIRSATTEASPLLESMEVLEDYRDPERVPRGQKGMLWTFHYRASDRTLTDEEVQRDHTRLTELLKTRFQLVLR